ncbi:SH3 domain-containing protein [Mesorhizobium sp. ZC-5]|jgi:uncharacterized protein YgiM (DUF1202 family)|uniref:SH3 domain-containing protein n=1 Tax=Mesorhizobium sp. ZC-5 TaxID=2986066 RepID=UPI0021E7A712|nr:SH3 domain-containing protein [Mesorhizobium sp. ZC-5]MCV3243534.1 SH3 domain-containing protein [Mesorhizobium sp. ZC-5]
MAGFVLPKLRWLVIGAVAAGGWAITQEPVSKREQRAAERPAVTRNVSKPAQRVQAEPQRSQKQPQRAIQPTSAADRPQASIPEPRPSKLTTSSIKRPDKPVDTRAFYTSERVRLREDASTSSRFITWLEHGQKATVLESSGKWRRVVVAGRKGWVHGDYLRLPDPNAPRPPEPVAKTVATRAKEPVPASRAREPAAPTSSLPLAGLLQSKRPAREAQRGDCQCPYDLMINGKQCGDRSAYVMRGRANEQCYL